MYFKYKAAAMKYKIIRINTVDNDNIIKSYKYKNIKCVPKLYYRNNYFDMYTKIGDGNYTSKRINKRYSHKILILEFISFTRRLKNESQN